MQGPLGGDIPLCTHGRTVVRWVTLRRLRSVPLRSEVSGVE